MCYEVFAKLSLANFQVGPPPPVLTQEFYNDYESNKAILGRIELNADYHKRITVQANK